jgi:hypothetical protein
VIGESDKEETCDEAGICVGVSSESEKEEPLCEVDI